MYTHERLKGPAETQKKKKQTRLLLALFESWETNSEEEEEKNTPSSRRNRTWEKTLCVLIAGALHTVSPYSVLHAQTFFSLSAAQLFAYTRIAPSLHLPASTFLDPIVCAGGHLLASPRTNAVFQQRITYWGLTNRFGLSVPTYSSPPPPHFLAYKTLENFHRHLWGLFCISSLWGTTHCCALPPRVLSLSWLDKIFMGGIEQANPAKKRDGHKQREKERIIKKKTRPHATCAHNGYKKRTTRCRVAPCFLLSSPTIFFFFE